MTVEQNTGFALKLAKLPKAEIGAKVRRAAQVLGLTHVLAEGARDADEEELVSGGQGVARVPPRARVRPGDQVRFAVDVGEMHFFDPVSGESIVDGRPAEVLAGAGG